MNKLPAMEEYSEIVKDAFASKSSFYIFNSTKEHAEIIIKNIVASAESEILFFTGCDESFFSKDKSLVDALVKKSKKVKIKIIQDCNSPEILSNKISLSAANCEIYNLVDSFDHIDLGTLIPRTGYDKVKHFIVADRRAFRAEIPHKPGEEIVQAIASPNTPNVAARLADLFNLLIEKKHAVSLPV